MSVSSSGYVWHRGDGEDYEQPSCGATGIVAVGNQPITCSACIAEMPAPKEAVQHPSHYGGGDNPYETIKVLKAWGLESDALLWNTCKYVSRAGKKDPSKMIEDLEKAAFYLSRRIADLKADQ